MSKILYIIDGHSHLYAAYYAIRGLTSPKGEPTNAVYGMTSVMLKILREHHPDYLLTVFDPPGKTFRQDLYSEYKANRPSMPDDLIGQVDIIRAVLKTLGITDVMVENYEADDVIATVTKEALNVGMDVVICTKDKDMQQLIGKHVKIYDTTKDKFIDEQVLFAEKKIRPDQVVDMLALMGDKADNVPGIPGVGPKTASNLIHDCETIEKIIELKDQLAPKIKNYLSEPENIEKLYLSRKLISLAKDAPIEFRPQDWTSDIPDKSALEKLFSELGFNRFLERLNLKKMDSHVRGNDMRGETENSKVQFRQIKSLDELNKLVEKLSKEDWIAVDTETTGIHPLESELVGVSFAFDGETGWYLPLLTIDSQHLSVEESLW